MSELTTPLTGLAIREYLRMHREGGPNDVYRELRKIKPSTSYDSVRRYFYILRRIGLIEFVRTWRGAGAWPKRLYRIASGMGEDPRWGAPQVALYPDTRFGRRRYRIAKGLA